MTDFTIDPNIPIPPKGLRHGRGNPRYPFAELEVGESFFVQVPAGATVGEIQHIRNILSNAACWHARKLGRQFTTRRVDGGVRVWRFE